MNATAKIDHATPHLTKLHPTLPALGVIDLGRVFVRQGTAFAGTSFADDTEVMITALEPGADYVVVVVDGAPVAVKADLAPGDDCLGGFHFAPGGNAIARAGGDSVPAINPCSLWDQRFRPVCPDPRSMVLVMSPGRTFWCDIYLTGTEHMIKGTSAFGAVIADGRACPVDPASGIRFSRFNYAAACAVMKHHGKSLLSFDEFAVAAFGVTEKSAADREPEATGLDAARTSRFGLMQATGNMWVWGHDGDPDEPRASLLGGSWLYDEYAGSRHAPLVYWAGYSNGGLGARGRSDHLMLA